MKTASFDAAASFAEHRDAPLSKEPLKFKGRGSYGANKTFLRSQKGSSVLESTFGLAKSIWIGREKWARFMDLWFSRDFLFLKFSTSKNIPPKTIELISTSFLRVKEQSWSLCTFDRRVRLPIRFLALLHIPWQIDWNAHPRWWSLMQFFASQKIFFLLLFRKSRIFI